VIADGQDVAEWGEETNDDDYDQGDLLFGVYRYTRIHLTYTTVRSVSHHSYPEHANSDHGLTSNN
jgi:hypothetical protein